MLTVVRGPRSALSLFVVLVAVLLAAPAAALAAFPGTNGNIYVGVRKYGELPRMDQWNPVTGATVGMAREQGQMSNISVSADGTQYIGYYGGTHATMPSGLYRSSTKSSELWRVNGNYFGAFLPDGRVLYRNGNQLRVVNQDGSGDGPMAGIYVDSDYLFFTVAPDGSAIYYPNVVGTDNVVWRQPLDGSARQEVYRHPAKGLGKPTPYAWVRSILIEDISPDGKTLLLLIESGNDVFGGGRVPPGQLYTVPTSGGSAKHFPTVAGSRPTGRFSPDGTKIAYVTTNEYADAGAPGGDISLYVANVEGGGDRRLGGYYANVQDMLTGFAWQPGPGFLLQLAGDQLIGDTVELDVTLRNLKSTTYRDLRYDDSGHAPGAVFNTAPFSESFRAKFTVLGGPVPQLESTLGAGEQRTHQYLVGIEKPGNIQVRAKVYATDDRTGPVEVEDAVYVVARNRDWEEWEQLATVAGGADSLVQSVQDDIDKVNRRAFDAVNKALKKSVPKSTWKSMSKATPFERGLARTLGLPDDAFAWLPNDPATARKVYTAFRTASNQAEMGVAKRALGTAYRKGIAEPWSYWSEYVHTNSLNPLPVLAQTYEEGKYWAGKGAVTTKSYAAAAYDFANAPDKQHRFDEAAGSAILSMESGLEQLGKAAPAQLRRFTKLAEDDPVKAGEMLGGVYGTVRGEVSLVAAQAVFSPNKAGVARGITNAGKAVEEFGKVMSLSRAGRVLNLAAAVEKRAAPLPSVAQLGMPAADVARWSKIVGQLEERAASRGVKVDISLSFRPRNYHSSLIENGLGKNMFVKKLKAGDDIDLLLGMDPSGLGKAAVYKPRLPANYRKLDASMQRQLKERAADMTAGYKEWNDKGSAVYKARTKTNGWTAKADINGNDVTTVKMKLSGVEKNGTISVHYDELVVDGRTILKSGSKPRPMVSDYDGNAILQVGGKDLPPSVRGLIELEAMRLQREAGVQGMATSFHGWTKNAFDMPAGAQRATFKFLIAGLPKKEAEKVIKKFVAKYGPDAEKLLGDAITKGGSDYVVQVTRNGAVAAQGY